MSQIPYVRHDASWLYKKLCNEDEDELRLICNLPDTIIFHEGHPVYWLYCNKRGEIVKKREFHLKTMNQKLFHRGDNESEKNPVAMGLTKRGEIKLLDLASTQNVFSFLPQSGMNYTGLQSFVRQRAGAESTFRNEYNIVNDKAKVVTSTYKIIKWSLQTTGVVTPLKQHQEMRSLNTALNHKIDEETSKIVKYIEHIDKSRVMSLVCEYAVDENDKLWFLIANSITVIYGDIRESAISNESDRNKLFKQKKIIAQRSKFALNSNDVNEDSRTIEITEEQVHDASLKVEMQTVHIQKAVFSVDQAETRRQFHISKSLITKRELENSHYPTPFKCHGDFCDYYLKNPSILGNLDIMKVAKDILTRKEWENLKNEIKHLSDGQELCDKPWSDITYKSIYYAKKEKRGGFFLTKDDEENNEVDEIVSTGIMRETVSQNLKRNYNKRLGIVEGGPSKYYQQVKVCQTCYSIYTLLDKAREIKDNSLEDIKESNKEKRKNNTSLSPISTDPKTKFILKKVASENSKFKSGFSIIEKKASQHNLLMEKSTSIFENIENPISYSEEREQEEEDKGKDNNLAQSLEIVDKKEEDEEREEEEENHKNAIKAVANENKVLTRGDARKLVKSSGGRQRYDDIDGYLRGKTKTKNTPNNKKSKKSLENHNNPSNPEVEESDEEEGEEEGEERVIDSASLPFRGKTDDEIEKLYSAKILLVEEDKITRDDIFSILEKEGYNVSLGNDGPQAMEMSRNNFFDCIILSSTLPTLNGIEVTKLIRQREKRGNSARSPILVFTDATAPEDLRLYMEVGMDGCVSKPGERNALLNTLSSAVPHHNPFINVTPKKKKKKIVAPEKLSLSTPLVSTQPLKSSSFNKRSNNNNAENNNHLFDDGYINGVFQMDADTAIPYTVVGKSTNKPVGLFNFVIIHDFFDTCERQQIFWTPIVNRFPGLQVLCFNYPGQAYTEWKKVVLLNNKYLASCTEALLTYLDDNGTGEFVTTGKPFYIMGFGNGANVSMTYSIYHHRLSMRGLLLINGFTYIDSHLSGVLHDCMNVFSCSPATRPDLPVYFYSRFLFSGSYLTKVSTPLALNMYTAVNNPITLRGRIQLCQGALSHEDLREAIRNLDIPTIAVHSIQNTLIKPLHLNALIEGRGGTIQSIQGALKGRKKVAVIWLKSGHEVFQECRKTIHSLFEQLVTGYHELHDVTFFPLEGSEALTYDKNSNFPGNYSKSDPNWVDSKVHPGTGINSINNNKYGNNKNNDKSKSFENKFINNILQTLNETKSSPKESKEIILDIQRERGMEDHFNEIERLKEHSKSIRAALQKNINSAEKNESSSPKKGNKKAQSSTMNSDYSLSSLDPENSSFGARKKSLLLQNQQQQGMTLPKDLPEVKEYMAWRVKRNKKRLDTLKEAAVAIQKCWRAYLAKTLVFRMRRQKAALNIQRVYRGLLGRRRANSKKKLDWAVRMIQRNWRGYIGRKTYHLMQLEEQAARELQRVYRGRLGKIKVRKIRTAREYAVLKIQTQFRAKVARREAFKRRLIRNKAIDIQRVYRGYRGRKRGRIERDKLLFSKAQTQGIEFGKQMLMESKFHGTKLQSEVSLLLKEKATTEENVEIVLQEIADFEALVKRLEKEMMELSRIEADSKGVLDEAGKTELRDQKFRLDKEFGSMLVKIADRKERLRSFEEKLQALDKARQIKESELGDLERKLVVLLEEQQRELEQIKTRQEKKNLKLKNNTGVENKKKNSQGYGNNPGPNLSNYSGPTPDQKKEAEDLMNSTETLMKFGFMSMSMTYFSSLNMIRAIKAVGAVDTNISAAMANSLQNGVPAAPLIKGMKHPGGSSTNKLLGDAPTSPTSFELVPSTSEFLPKLKEGELVRATEIEVHRWSVTDVCDWLATLSLSQYKEAFQDASIDGPFLYDLNDEDLRNTLGIEHGLHRKKILNSIKRLRQLDKGRDGFAKAPSSIASSVTNDSLRYAAGQSLTISGGVNSPQGNRKVSINTSLPQTSAIASPKNLASPLGSPGSPIAVTAANNNNNFDVDEDSNKNTAPGRINFEELESFVRNGKYKNVKETLSIIQETTFDKRDLLQQNTPGFGTQYIDTVRLSHFHINKSNEVGNTLFMVACQNGHEKIAKFLFKLGSYVNHQNNSGNTALHFAMTYGFYELGAWMTNKEEGAGADDTILNASGNGVYDGL